ncbi:MAG: TonB family protein [Elusimicrobia bacterium]|nr:TonB family protein [Elusimicrobiota bacterium]
MPDKGAVIRDTFFLGVAVVLHGAIFAVDPGLRWGTLAAPERIIPIEFVQAPFSPFLAPIPPGDGRGDEMPDNGPGPVVIPKTPRPEPKAKPQLSAPKPEPEKAAAKPKAPEPAAKAQRPKPKRAGPPVKPGPTPAQIARAQVRQRRIDLTRELAALKDPDEAVADSSEGVAAADLALQDHGRPGPRSQASLETGPSAASDPDLKDALNSQPMGGGIKRTEGSISWSIDGPLGTRRLLQRRLPISPEWVSQRGLDLTVQVKFQVLEDGSVKPGAIIKVTSGFPELDRLALDAIKLWKFEAVPKLGASAPQTWGVVTLRFTM